MPQLQQLFSERRQAFERELLSAPDAKSAADACKRQLMEIRRAVLDQLEDRGQRVRLNQFMAIAEAGISCMMSVSKVDISMKLTRGSDAAQKTRRTLRSTLIYLPPLLCVALGVYLFMDERTNAMLLALAAAAASYYALYRLKTPSRVLPDVAGVTRVDPQELLRRVERMLQDMDLLMDEYIDEQAQPLVLNQGMLEALQMLMEAKLTSDGEFALRALPQVLDALNRQGVAAQMFDADSLANFDLLPAPEDGETIRPALVRDGQVLVRGQATVKG